MFQLCLSRYVLIIPCILVLSFEFDFVWSTRYFPGVSCPCQSCLVLPCLDVLIKYYYLSLCPRLRVPVPPSCVHRDRRHVSANSDWIVCQVCLNTGARFTHSTWKGIQGTLELQATWSTNFGPLGLAWSTNFEKETIDQGSPNSVLEGRCPAEFSSNPNQTHLNQLIKVLLGILETSRQVCWGKLELISAGHRPSRTECGDPCYRWSALNAVSSWNLAFWFIIYKWKFLCKLNVTFKVVVTLRICHLFSQMHTLVQNQRKPP